MASCAMSPLASDSMTSTSGCSRSAARAEAAEPRRIGAHLALAHQRLAVDVQHADLRLERDDVVGTLLVQQVDEGRHDGGHVAARARRSPGPGRRARSRAVASPRSAADRRPWPARRKAKWKLAPGPRWSRNVAQRTRPTSANSISHSAGSPRRTASRQGSGVTSAMSASISAPSSSGSSCSGRTLPPDAHVRAGLRHQEELRGADRVGRAQEPIDAGGA